MRKALGILALALSMTLVSCGDAAGPGPLGRAGVELAHQRARWAESGIEDYVLTVRHLCECLPEAVGPVAVVVRSAAVESRTYETTGQPVEPSLAGLVPSVEGLFDVVEDGIEREAERVDVEYDPLGFPRRVLIDADLQTADDEALFEVTGFVPQDGAADGSR